MSSCHHYVYETLWTVTQSQCFIHESLANPLLQPSQFTLSLINIFSSDHNQYVRWTLTPPPPKKIGPLILVGEFVTFPEHSVMKIIYPNSKEMSKQQQYMLQ